MINISNFQPVNRGFKETIYDMDMLKYCAQWKLRSLKNKHVVICNGYYKVCPGLWWAEVPCCVFLIREGKKEMHIVFCLCRFYICELTQMWDFFKSCVRARNGLTCEDAFFYKPGSVSLIHGCDFGLHKDGRSWAHELFFDLSMPAMAYISIHTHYAHTHKKKKVSVLDMVRAYLLVLI